MPQVERTEPEPTTMPSVEIKQPGSQLGEKAILATALLEAGTSVRKTAKAVGISPRTASRLSANKNKGAGLEHLDQEQIRKVRSAYQDKCLLLSDGLLGVGLYAKADKAGLGETVAAAAKLAELAGIKQPDRTEHFHAVMLKFTSDSPGHIENQKGIIEAKSE